MNDWLITLSKLKVDGNEEQLKIGTIFKMSMDEKHGITPKHGQKSRDKFFIVIGFTDDGNIIGVVIINKEINEHDYTPELYVGHYELRLSNYKGVLERNSFACCNRIKELNRGEVASNASFEGCLIEDDYNLIMEHLKESKIITPKTKKKFGLINP
jgi:hypothetical protein